MCGVHIRVPTAGGCNDPRHYTQLLGSAPSSEGDTSCANTPAGQGAYYFQREWDLRLFAKEVIFVTRRLSSVMAPLTESSAMHPRGQNLRSPKPFQTSHWCYKRGAANNRDSVVEAPHPMCSHRMAYILYMKIEKNTRTYKDVQARGDVTRPMSCCGPRHLFFGILTTKTIILAVTHALNYVHVRKK